MRLRKQVGTKGSWASNTIVKVRAQDSLPKRPQCSIEQGPAMRLLPNQALRPTFPPSDTRGRCWLRCHNVQSTAPASLRRAPHSKSQLEFSIGRADGCVPLGARSLGEHVSGLCDRGWPASHQGLHIGNSPKVVRRFRLWAARESGQMRTAFFPRAWLKPFSWVKHFWVTHLKTPFWTHISMTAWANHDASEVCTKTQMYYVPHLIWLSNSPRHYLYLGRKNWVLRGFAKSHDSARLQQTNLGLSVFKTLGFPSGLYCWAGILSYWSSVKHGAGVIVFILHPGFTV